MLVVKYLLCIIGFGLLLGAAGILAHDLYRLLRKPPDETPPTPRWRTSVRMALAALAPLLLGLSMAVVPGGQAGVCLNQFSGTRPATLYPGVHWMIPLVERVELFDTRDRVYSTALPEDPKRKVEALRVQTREGLSVALAVSVRYRIDPRRLPYLFTNLPQPVELEIVPPVVASAFRQAAPNYLVRELFASRRDEVARGVAGDITKRLAGDGLVVKEVMLRDIQLPAEYAKGLEGLLLKEQENERLNVELEVKQKMVKAAEYEADAQKAREVTEAEARAQVTVLEAKAQADAMQHTLPLKQKQIEQMRLEAEARAQAKVIDSRADLERRKLVTLGEADRIRNVAAADAERLKMEAEVLKQSPLLIQKIIAEKLSDKVQIMMVPSDGKFFFANDVLKGVPTAVAARE